jgi:membrane associated rhomboid family serine protease
MTLNVLTIILAVTVIVSLMAFSNREMMGRMMFNPSDIKNYKNYQRFFSHMLIHADYMHLGFNMMALYFLGDLFLNQMDVIYTDAESGGLSYYPEFGENTEMYVDAGLKGYFGNVQGQVHFLILYIGGGVFSTLVPYMRNQDNPAYRSLGASGAVSAIVFASILWNPNMELQLLFIPIPIKAYIFGILYLLFEYYMDKRGGSGIAHDAHIGGAIFGVFYVLIINIDKGKEFFTHFF